MQSKAFNISQNNRGNITNLQLSSDSTHMNWVIDPDYLASVNYHDADKLFGEFTATINGHTFNSIDYVPSIDNNETSSNVTFKINDVDFIFNYQLKNDYLEWNISVVNTSQQVISLDNLGIWTSLAYVMFRDLNVKKNANQSAAVFPSISPDFTKLAVTRRDNTNSNLGVYATKGKILSVGTYNEYNNRFFENVSPSLDGLLFHQLILAGGYPDNNGPKNDWIYSQESITLELNEHKDWQLSIAQFTDNDDFYKVANRFDHPTVKFSPLVTDNQSQVITFETNNNKIDKIIDQSCVNGNVTAVELTNKMENNVLMYSPSNFGEHKVIIELTDGRQDMIVFNYMSSIKQLIRNRADYLSEHSYAGKNGKVPYSFTPVSNQGEALGKMNFILQACLIDTGISESAHKIQQVEESAVKYVRSKWFEDGDFTKPTKLYGDFYRVMDLEYIAHLYYLLSQCPADCLELNSPKDYLNWAAEVFDTRVNPDRHADERGKTEAQMLGQYFLFIEDLLKDLKKNGLNEKFEEISKSWKSATNRIASDSSNLSAAMTEHFYDNAGFGPAAGALALSNHQEAAHIYGELLKANIGFSNDFRAQSPDRWWEALSYMVHSLWGGVTSAAALITGRALGDPELVKAGYRGTVAVLYMYDSNANTTNRILEPGDAASTYSIAGPNLNRPDLSRDRFGQSVFASDGGIFTRLFPDGYTGEDDWDMGEELVAYLNGFGQETFIYTDENGSIQVINGSISENNGDTMNINSHAPYPNRYIDLTNGTTFESKQATVVYNTNTNGFTN
ncbi:hypothetical protein FC70_GL001030 [Paucilactobacillus oligofermentans DSM 15707 = LMG 22743]|uniref:Uncharacterized protein n=1 Tax=Paucilactobacillus oligofermentans DSM 15707 = LMG 22743 TaxID=1423778 RepID=A0A0R1RGD6_9LACO|nr:hypothetical protein [Paucilactobacillus oligofermentans]KRL55433.1 hypothetical protein FC70_GL001030 [Paucilactobacillus oligofermentans DSM 15707 = LMG 22743]CUS25577.1 Uncharacterized protein LACOL_0269 [Paucilactobacillus oligofermentans DSM 15707 = LMG 22743]